MAQIKLFTDIDTPYEGMVTTRYQGSKRKLLPELYGIFSGIEFDTCLDAFGGTGSVTHLLKNMGKDVTYNDILPANSTTAKALFSNNEILINENTIENIFTKKNGKIYKNFIAENYEDVYFTTEENEQLDILAQNIKEIDNEIARAELYYCLFQSTISKRPYNLFHRANLHMRLKDVKRNFGNKTTWDKPFLDHMLKFYRELKAYKYTISENTPKILSKSAFEIKSEYDLVYIDTPYAKSDKAQESNYFNFYHFLDAILDYTSLNSKILSGYAHKPIYEPKKLWYEEDSITEAFKALFQNYRRSKLVISYRSDGHPTPDELVSFLKTNYKNVDLLSLAEYKYVLSSRKTDTREIAIIAT